MRPFRNLRRRGRKRGGVDLVPGGFRELFKRAILFKNNLQGGAVARRLENFRALPLRILFKDYDIKEPETVKISSQGKFAASIDRKIFFAGEPPEITLPAGRHTLKIAVFNYEKSPQSALMARA